LRAAGFDPVFLAGGALAESADVLVYLGAGEPPELRGRGIAVTWGERARGHYLPSDASPSALRACIRALCTAVHARRSAAPAEELGKTSAFLARLINAAVDGIVAADITGRVTLFNRGAERITGYRAEELVGRMSVAELYQPGGARTIMAELRAEGSGGVGRLEGRRIDIRSREGGTVPVNMTAALIYEDGREVASVGIFTDLRDRIRIEERLQAAQEKLVLSEKQALIAELAGTTAHELNQPLTSVIGYAELVKRKLAPDDSHYRAIDTILQEAQRMADIVRKIGQITRYETKTYVGSTQILDLDKSTGR
jgi:PAS domain S-box-containing protein